MDGFTEACRLTLLAHSNESQRQGSESGLSNCKDLAPYLDWCCHPGPSGWQVVSVQCILQEEDGLGVFQWHREQIPCGQPCRVNTEWTGPSWAFALKCLTRVPSCSGRVPRHCPRTQTECSSRCLWFSFSKPSCTQQVGLGWPPNLPPSSETWQVVDIKGMNEINILVSRGNFFLNC